MSGRREDWEWDETLFSGCAEYYEQGRVPYAPGLAESFATELGLDGSGRLLDVGCGPGTVALRLASRFDAVVGLDPDPGMLAEAARLASQRAIGNASWVCLRAESLPAGLGTFRVVTFAASFHWMDRLRVATAARGMLGAGGAAVQVDAPGYRPPDHVQADMGHPQPPDDAVADLVRSWLGPDRRAGRGIRNSSPSGEDAVFQEAGFLPAVEVSVPDGRMLERSVDDLIALQLSSSNTAPHLFGDRLPTFVDELRSVLSDASPSGLFSVWLPPNVLRIWRLP